MVLFKINFQIKWYFDKLLEELHIKVWITSMCLSIDLINFEVVPSENQIKFIRKSKLLGTDRHTSQLLVHAASSNINFTQF